LLEAKAADPSQGPDPTSYEAIKEADGYLNHLRRPLVLEPELRQMIAGFGKGIRNGTIEYNDLESTLSAVQIILDPESKYRDEMIKLLEKGLQEWRPIMYINADFYAAADKLRN